MRGNDREGPGRSLRRQGEGLSGEQIRLLMVEDVPQVASHVRALLQAQSQIKMLDVIDLGEQVRIARLAGEDVRAAGHGRSKR
jgi:hypothetical protein